MPARKYKYVLNLQSFPTTSNFQVKLLNFSKTLNSLNFNLNSSVPMRLSIVASVILLLGASVFAAPTLEERNKFDCQEDCVEVFLGCQGESPRITV